MTLQTESYQSQLATWPEEGRHILAQHDAESVVVYQAYRPAIGDFAASHGYFGGPFRLDRMSWIKTNFLWMMYRSGWGQKEGQQVVLAIRLQRAAFDSILSQAVHSTFQPGVYADCTASKLSQEAAWRIAVRKSDVRLQWDPDHEPFGNPVQRRAIQLGLRGEVLTRYAREWIVGIEDVSEFVNAQYTNVEKNDLTRLVIPREEIYPVTDAATRKRLQLSQ